MLVISICMVYSYSYSLLCSCIGYAEILSSHYFYIKFTITVTVWSDLAIVMMLDLLKY